MKFQLMLVQMVAPLFFRLMAPTYCTCSDNVTYFVIKYTVVCVCACMRVCNSLLVLLFLHLSYVLNLI